MKQVSLTPKQRAFLEALLVSQTIEEAVEKADISKSTAYKYMKENEEFKTELRQRKNNVLTHISTRLNQLGIDALNTLETIINDDTGKVTPASKVTASRAILEYMYRAKEVEDLEVRLEELESYLEHLKAQEEEQTQNERRI